MIIELIGIPGAGKTTIATELRNGMERDEQLSPFEELGDQSESKLRRFGGYLNEVWTHRAIILLSLKLLRGSRRKRYQKMFAMRRLIVSLQRQTYATNYPDRLSLFGEGYLQQLHMLLVEGPESPASDVVTRLVNAGTQADMVVHVQIHPETALTRLKNREGGITSRFADYSESVQLETLQAGAAMFESIVRILTERKCGTPKVVAIPGDDRRLAYETLKDLIRENGQVARVHS